MIFDFTEVAVRDVSRHYGRRRALSHVSLECRAGEVLGLLGPNGAGKSTLLSILATLLAPSAGEVRYGTKTAAEAGPTLRARLGFLSHDLHLYPELTARENLLFFARLYGLPDVGRPRGRRTGAARAWPRAATISSRASRAACASASPSSGRSCTTLACCCSTSRSPASTTPRWRRSSRACRNCRAAQRIVVVVTHDLDVAERLLDTVAVLKDGRLAAFDEAHGRIREHYRAHVAAGDRCS